MVRITIRIRENLFRSIFLSSLKNSITYFSKLYYTCSGVTKGRGGQMPPNLFPAPKFASFKIVTVFPNFALASPPEKIFCPPNSPPPPMQFSLAPPLYTCLARYEKMTGLPRVKLLVISILWLKLQLWQNSKYSQFLAFFDVT